MLPYTLRNQPTPGAKRTLPPLCADVGLMTFGMKAVRIWVFCACMGRLAEVMQVSLACPGPRPTMEPFWALAARALSRYRPGWFECGSIEGAWTCNGLVALGGVSVVAPLPCALCRLSS